MTLDDEGYFSQPRCPAHAVRAFHRSLRTQAMKQGIGYTYTLLSQLHLSVSHSISDPWFVSEAQKHCSLLIWSSYLQCDYIVNHHYIVKL